MEALLEFGVGDFFFFPPNIEFWLGKKKVGPQIIIIEEKSLWLQYGNLVCMYVHVHYIHIICSGIWELKIGAEIVVFPPSLWSLVGLSLLHR